MCAYVYVCYKFYKLRREQKKRKEGTTLSREKFAKAHLSPLMQYVLSFSSFTASIFTLGFLSETCILRAPFGIVTILVYAAKRDIRCIVKKKVKQFRMESVAHNLKIYRFVTLFQWICPRPGCTSFHHLYIYRIYPQSRPSLSPNRIRLSTVRKIYYKYLTRQENVISCRLIRIKLIYSL